MAMHGSGQRSSWIGLGLSIVLAFFFAIFIGAAAFNPGLLAGPVTQGSAISLWFVYGQGLIWCTVIMIGLYVWRANGAGDQE